MKEEEGKKDTRGCSKKKGTSSIRNIFMHADAFDVWLMTFGILGAVGDGLSTPAAALLIGRITNNLFSGPLSSSSVFTHNIDKNMVIILYLSCGTFMASFLEGYCWTRTGERQASRMRAQYLKAVLRQDIAYFDLKGASTADVITSISSDSLIIQDVLGEKVPNFIMNGAMFLGSYFVGFMLAWRLTLVALPTVVLLIIPGLMYGRMLVTLTKKIRTEYNKASTIAEQAISSIRTVYSFVGENKTMTEFSAALDNSVKLGLRQGLVKGIAIGSNAVTFAIWALMNWYGSHLVMYYGIPGGNILATGLSIVSGGLAFGSGLANVKYIAEAISAGERIMEVLKRVPEIDSESMEGEILDGVSGEIEFRGIEFAYPSRLEDQILKDFNLKIPTGRTVALVGGSGSGKSTVIALLERFYNPSRGQILLDGVDIKKLKLKWLRSQMGLVSQEPALFDTSIKENILFGKENATMEEVVTAAKVAHAHNFISQQPDGYDTRAGARGVQLSGGQKQRIAIARAILKSPKVLLLDEATSALDSESERIVQEALDLASVGRTTLVIAHRLSTIRNADVIAVVQGGKVMEIGAHNQLIKNKKGLYSSLIRLQQMPLATEELGVLPPLPSQAPPSSFNTPPPGGNLHESDEPEQHLPVSYFRRLLMLNKPEWKHATFGCLSAIFFGGIQPLFAFTLGSTASVYFLKDQNEIKSKAKAYSVIFLFLSIFSFLINIVQHYNFGAMGEYLIKRVREQMLFKILAFEIGWFDQEKNSSGAICSRLASDAYAVRSLVGDRMSLIVQAFSAIIIAWTMGLIISWRLALVIIVIQPIVIICFYGRKVLLRRISNKVIKAQSASSKLASEAVSNLRTVTAFSSQDHILHLFHLAQQSPRRESIRQSWFAGLGLGASQSLLRCTWALALWYGSRLMLNGDLTAKHLFQTFIILNSTGRVIADAGSTTTELDKGIHAISSVFDVLDQDSRIEPEDPTGFIPDKLNGSVEIIGIDFAYPTRPDIIIFKAFSLTIEAGKSTALVGQSGSGKSTIIGLIERFYDPLQGTIRIDGRDIKSYHLRTLRKHIALVGQEPVLFSGSIRENIKYGVKQATEAEVEEATRAANAHDFISSLKEGYDTWCGDQGLHLSGGQKQRIAIARAILKKPTILLLDEATSALDSQSEKVVQEALEQVMVGTTSIVVAHRLSTIKNCDLIVVLQKGRVVEIGTHAPLLAKGSTGSYCRLVRNQ